MEKDAIEASYLVFSDKDIKAIEKEILQMA